MSGTSQQTINNKKAQSAFLCKLRFFSCGGPTFSYFIVFFRILILRLLLLGFRAFYSYFVPILSRSSIKKT